MFADYWPTEQSKDEIIADRLNGTSKYIFSKSLAGTPWGKWNNATQVKEDAVAYIRNLKQQEGKDMVLWGSLSLGQSLLREGLIDEVELRICPVAIGKGRTVFPDDMKYINLELLDNKHYRSGLVMMKYKVLS
jgi:dihydrofolate reductase